MGNGKLTADQVCACVQHVYLEGYSDGSVNRGVNIDETDWQTIADKLNAILGVSECECYSILVWRWAGPTTYFEYTLSCGHVITSEDNKPPNFCEMCGARIRKALEQ